MEKGKMINEKFKKIFWSVFSTLFAVLTLWILLKQNENVSLGDIARTAATANHFWLISAAVSSLLFILFEGFAVCSILKGAGFKRNKTSGILYATADIYFSAITPSATGGQPASAYFMMKDGIPGGVTTAVLLLNLMMYTLSIVALGALSVLICPGAFMTFNLPSKILIAAGTVAQLALAAFFMVILKKGSFIFNLLKKAVYSLGRKKLLRHPEKKIAKISKAKSDYFSCSQLFSGNYPLLFRAFMWNFFQRTAQILVPSLLYMSLGGNAENGFRLFSRQCLITIGYNFIPLPGAMGVADYLMLNGFSDITGRDMAFHLEMLSRGLTFYLCVSLSGLITLVGYLIVRRKFQYAKAEKLSA